jgi:mannitol-1-phosphate 5-dehydrogenase
MAGLRAYPELMAFLRAAFIEESGRALIKKYAGLDPLFTGEGYRWYANDLLMRMTNPHLGDTVERVGRDPRRKLGWDDRLIGTMRLALSQGITPRRYALGAAAALAVLNPATLEQELYSIWATADAEPAEQQEVLTLVKEGQAILQRWLASADTPLEQFFK